MKRYLCIFILICFTVCNAQDSITPCSTNEITYGPIQGITFSPEKINAFKSIDDFKYLDYQEKESWWTKKKKWLLQHLNNFLSWLFGIDEITGFWATLLKLIPYLLILVLLYILGRIFMKMNPSDLLFEKTEMPQTHFTEEDDIIKNKNIEELIKQSIQNKNYRLTIRYYYLLVLKNLNAKELIEWETYKTNKDYITELKNSELHESFKTLTELYDSIWYGNFEIDKPQFESASLRFKPFIKRLSNV